MKQWLSRFNVLDANTEQLSLFKLGWTIQSMLDFDKAEKMYKMLELSNKPSNGTTLGIWSLLAKNLLHASRNADSDRLLIENVAFLR